MSKFKVGDIVRRIKEANGREYNGVSYTLPVGTVCRVTHVKGPWIATPTETWPYHKGENSHLLSLEDYFELVDIPKPQPAVVKQPFNYTYGQSRGAKQAVAKAVAGGIHLGSLGGAYPYAPVAYANGDKVHWEVHNLQDGTVLCSSATDQPFVYGTAKGAIDTLHAFVTDRLAVSFVWIPTRLLPAPAAELTPREAYQAAMEKEADHA